MGNDRAIHHIKFDGESAPEIGSRDHYSGYSAVEIKEMLAATNPRAIEEAGHAYKSAAGTLQGSHTLIRDVAAQLAQVWSGDASIQAQQALQLVHKTVQELAIRCGQLGPPLVQYGAEALPKYTELAATRPSAVGFLDGLDILPGDDIATGHVGGGYLITNKSNNDFARDDLVNLNKELVKLYNDIPPTVEKDLPILGGPAGPALTNQDYPGGIPGGVPPGGGIPGGGYPGGGYGGLPGGGGYGGYPGGGSGGAYPGGGGYTGPGLPGYPGGGSGGGGLPGGYPGGGSGGVNLPGGGTLPGGGNLPGGGAYPGVTDPGGGLPGGGSNPAYPGYPGAGGPGSGQPGTVTMPAGYSPDQQGGLNPNDPRATHLAGFEPTTPTVPTATGPGTGPGIGLPQYNGTGPGIGTGPSTTSLGPNGLNGPNSLNGLNNPTGTGPGTWVGNGATTGGAGGGLNAVNGVGGTRGAGVGTGMGMGGMPFMPMGGSPGEGNQDRERSTWLVEDEDVWGGDGGTAPAVIT
ncbi:WXG100 family type VII secretion target [Streptosporangium longisporum]|uniref:PPE family domain-containing protein n=1 Tax=Streptosporangium longisporum TaxID=46187 RepID=A0ABN3XZ68_9ACTN